MLPCCPATTVHSAGIVCCLYLANKIMMMMRMMMMMMSVKLLMKDMIHCKMQVQE